MCECRCAYVLRVRMCVSELVIVCVCLGLLVCTCVGVCVLMCACVCMCVCTLCFCVCVCVFLRAACAHVRLMSVESAAPLIPGCASGKEANPVTIICSVNFPHYLPQHIPLMVWIPEPRFFSDRWIHVRSRLLQAGAPRMATGCYLPASLNVWMHRALGTFIMLR
jgi:hypothetical protein